MSEQLTDISPQRIVDIDKMARAACTWVRQQAMEQRFLGLPVTAAEESELAAGFLAGLKARLFFLRPFADQGGNARL